MTAWSMTYDICLTVQGLHCNQAPNASTHYTFVSSVFVCVFIKFCQLLNFYVRDPDMRYICARGILSYPRATAEYILTKLYKS